MSAEPKRRFASLRARITLAMLLLGALSTAVFAFGVFIGAERMERSVLNRHIRAEFQTLAANLETHPALDSVKSALLLGFVGRQNPALPSAFAALAPGVHHAVRVGDKAYQVYVGDAHGRRLYVGYDITEWEALEQPVIYVLVGGVVLSALLAVWIGFWASGELVAPVTSLAARLKKLDPRQRNVRIAPDFVGDEVTPIAEAFDRYMERLDGFVEREQLFTAAAAHELRTPLAVMQGATEVLLEQPNLPPGARRAAERIARAQREMREYSEALLFLSRETRADDGEPAGCELDRVARELTESYRPLVDAAAVALEYRGGTDLRLDVPPALPAIVVGNLLRNAIEHTRAGGIRVETQGSRLSVTDTGCGIPAEALGSLFDRRYSTKPSGGMGLHLAKRICERFGWRLTIDSRPGEGTAATVDFSAAG